ncbi:MAG: hypothetical protein JKY17_04575 [Magnetovibrio sp.]|nr:hypothetical protein [Magnetovibrio sp.]
MADKIIHANQDDFGPAYMARIGRNNDQADLQEGDRNTKPSRHKRRTMAPSGLLLNTGSNGGYYGGLS